MWWCLCQDHFPQYYIGFDLEFWQGWMIKFYDVAVNPQAPLESRLLAYDSFHTMVRLTDSLPNPKFNNKGQEWWDKEKAEKGMEGPWEEPVVPEFGLDPASDVDSLFGDYDDYSDDEPAEDPLMPRGGFLPYAVVTEKQLSQIARAA